MSNCSSWSKLSDEEATLLLEEIPSLIEHAALTGSVSSEIMRDFLGKVVEIGDIPSEDEDDEMQPAKKKKRAQPKPVEERPQSQQRALWLNHQGVVAARVAARQAIEEAAQLKQAAAAQKKIDIQAKKDAAEKLKADKQKEKEIKEFNKTAL
jgi:hypothetical protein